MRRILARPSSVALASLAFAAWSGLAVAGCSSGYPAASCEACDGRTFSSSDCARFAAVAGCASSSVETPGAGCSGRCVFTDCTGIPICTGLAAGDAGAHDDAPGP